MGFREWSLLDSNFRGAARETNADHTETARNPTRASPSAAVADLAEALRRLSPEERLAVIRDSGIANANQ